MTLYSRIFVKKLILKIPILPQNLFSVSFVISLTLKDICGKLVTRLTCIKILTLLSFPYIFILLNLKRKSVLNTYAINRRVNLFSERTKIDVFCFRLLDCCCCFIMKLKILTHLIGKIAYTLYNFNIRKL